MDAIDGFLVAAGRASTADFARRFPGCFLWVEPFAPQRDAGFVTVGGQAPSGTQHALARVQKRSGANTFSWMVTLGRAPNNDIVVGARDVSKFHAMLREAEGGLWLVTDCDSSYGTEVNGARLEPQHPAALEPGSRLRLGTVAMTFHSSASLHAALRAFDA